MADRSAAMAYLRRVYKGSIISDFVSVLISPVQ
jgi:hypothetical protein